MPSRLVVLISGNGSNLQAIIDAIAQNQLQDAEICLVVSNKKDAYGLQRAQQSRIKTEYLNLVSYKRKYPAKDQSNKAGPQARLAYDKDLASLILDAKPDLVVCAGWMHILSDGFLAPLAEEDVPVINLHPALPGEYDGADALKRAFADFKTGLIKRTGLMIHYVIRQVDRGEPILTQELEIRQGDTIEDLEGRLHAAEHELIVRGAAKALATQRSKKHVPHQQQSEPIINHSARC